MTHLETLRAALDTAKVAHSDAIAAVDAARNAATTYACYFAALRLDDAANAAHSNAIAAARAAYDAAKAIDNAGKALANAAKAVA